MNINEYGFEIIADNISVQVLVTTQPQNIKKLEPELHSTCLKVVEIEGFKVFFFKWIVEYVRGI